MTQQQIVEEVQAILPPGNGARSNAIINGAEVKRQAARYLVDGRAAYSVEDAAHLIALKCPDCGGLTMALYDDGSKLCGRCVMEAWQ